jgi:hypothetical protein
MEKCEQHIKYGECPRRKGKPIIGGEPRDLPPVIENPQPIDCDKCIAGNEAPARRQCEFLYKSSSDDVTKCIDAALCSACKKMCPKIQKWQPTCPPFPPWPPKK